MHMKRLAALTALGQLFSHSSAVVQSRAAAGLIVTFRLEKKPCIIGMQVVCLTDAQAPEYLVCRALRQRFKCCSS